MQYKSYKIRRKITLETLKTGKTGFDEMKQTRHPWKSEFIISPAIRWYCHNIIHKNGLLPFSYLTLKL